VLLLLLLVLASALQILPAGQVWKCPPATQVQPTPCLQEQRLAVGGCGSSCSRLGPEHMLAAE
jgi:hypothetical protein